MKRIYLILFVFLAGKCFSQNLVINPSFEDTIGCTNYTGPPSFPCIPWYESVVSPDYFSSVYDPSCGFTAVPSNVFGFQYPKSGYAYMGFEVYVNPYPIPDRREYLGGILSDSLKANHKYCVTFFVSSANNCKFVIDAIGIYFSDDSIYVPSTNSVLPYIPQVQSQQGILLSDTLNWIQIAGDFIAQGGEKYLTIGNFNTDSNTTVDSIVGAIYNFSYYYIDDISVIDCTVGIDEINNIEDEIIIFPNPFTNQITVNSPDKEGNIEIRNLLGEIVFQTKLFNQHTKIDVTHLSQGMYFLSVKTKREIYSAKVIKQ